MAPTPLTGRNTAASHANFDSIESALAALRNGEGIVVMDNEDRENEGDFIFAAEKATPELLAFTIRYSSGYICVGMDPDRLDELNLPLMVKDSTDPLRTQYTISVDAAEGVSTGISAADRSRTIEILGNFDIKNPAALRRPGHVLPLRARKGGVIERGGHTEAATDLMRLAGMNPAGALCELVALVRSPQSIHAADNLPDEDDEQDRQQCFGLVHDCALFEGVEEHVRYAAGGTVAAANILVEGQAQIAIHWEGGRHHCQRSKAAGFCYVNDVVLGILALQKRFSRVLYIDLDLHHGDGVQDAFLYSGGVMTLSLHHHDRGFYPNSGGELSEGRGNGAGYSINVPLQRGTNDNSFIHVFSAVANKMLMAFDPEVIVVQCGCDGLAGDPHKVFNLTSNAFAQPVKTVFGWGRPVLLLGGGGYSWPECARCWTRLTAIACGYDIVPETDIPEHVFLNEYAPGFDMLTDVMLIEDSNTKEYLESIIQEIQAALPNQS
ncbi:Histone deacetylase 8 [Coemansia sp. RSA 1853]|nr:Histone deacetylase 8 [Coemansia sp. RSA 1853]